MEKELKDLLTEFKKVTDQIIDLKEVNIVSQPVIQLHQVLLDQIIQYFESKEEVFNTFDIGIFEVLGVDNATKETLSPTSIWESSRRG